MKKYYVIESNNEKGMYWNFSGGKSGNGVWEKTGSYYYSEKAAQKEIDDGVDGHIEYDEF